MHLCAVVGPLSPPLPARPGPSGSPAFSPGCLSCSAGGCSRTPCACPLLISAPPLPCRPSPSPPPSSSPLYSPPHRVRRHSEGRRLPPSVCTLLSTVSAVAVHSPVFSTRGFHLCPTPMSLPFPPQSGRTLTLSTLKCYRPQAMCYPRDPRRSPQSGRYRFTPGGESINMQTGMWSCTWMGMMIGRELLRRELVDETSNPSRGRQE